MDVCVAKVCLLLLDTEGIQQISWEECIFGNGGNHASGICAIQYRYHIVCAMIIRENGKHWDDENNKVDDNLITAFRDLIVRAWWRSYVCQGRGAMLSLCIVLIWLLFATIFTANDYDRAGLKGKKNRRRDKKDDCVQGKQAGIWKMRRRGPREKWQCVDRLLKAGEDLQQRHQIPILPFSINTVLPLIPPYALCRKDIYGPGVSTEQKVVGLCLAFYRKSHIFQTIIIVYNLNYNFIQNTFTTHPM